MEDEKMAVVIQRLTGSACGDFFYPAISGVAQSYNFYPISHLKPEEGIAHIALGLGKTVVEGGPSLRFCPRYPQFLPQFSTVDDILKNAQRHFYALKLKDFPESFGANEDATLTKLEVDDTCHHEVLKHLASSYSTQDHRIRDGAQAGGYLVLTFANILKYKSFPLAEILSDVLEIGRMGMGCPVEMEFAVNLPLGGDRRPSFDLLQIRPMGISQHHMDVEIREEDVAAAICYSTTALGNGRSKEIADIVFCRFRFSGLVAKLISRRIRVWRLLLICLNSDASQLRLVLLHSLALNRRCVLPGGFPCVLHHVKTAGSRFFKLKYQLVGFAVSGLTLVGLSKQ